MGMRQRSVRDSKQDDTIDSTDLNNREAFLDMFGVLVHSCFVDDGAGQNRFQLLDQHGSVQSLKGPLDDIDYRLSIIDFCRCSIDPVILGDLTYNQQGNMAYVESHVFKFADKVTTYFQCAMSLCMKADGACVGLTVRNKYINCILYRMFIYPFPFSATSMQ